jgi:hypothetical protein
MKLSAGRVFLFFSDGFSGKRTADPERSIPTYYASMDAVLAKDMPMAGLIDTSHLMGELTPKKTLIAGSPMWISSLNVYARRPISAHKNIS